MFDRLFWWMMRRRWNLTALDICVSYAMAMDKDDWTMEGKIAHLQRIHRDVLAAKQRY